MFIHICTKKVLQITILIFVDCGMVKIVRPYMLLLTVDIYECTFTTLGIILLIVKKS
jgi:hypothetical protein